MIRRISLSLILAVCAMGLTGHAVAADRSEKMIEKSAPFVQAALSQPIDGLYAQAKTAQADKELTFALAQWSGRITDAEFTPEDAKAIRALDARIEGPVLDYVKDHPGENHTEVNWREKLKITPAELEVVHRYQMAYLAEFWLPLALSRNKRGFVQNFIRPNAAMIGNGQYAGGSSLPSAVYMPLIDPAVAYTAMECVRAVRVAVGLSYQPLVEHPLSIRLLRDFTGFDIDYELKLRAQKRNALTGPAACGKADRFEGYVATLKGQTG